MTDSNPLGVPRTIACNVLGWARVFLKVALEADSKAILVSVSIDECAPSSPTGDSDDHLILEGLLMVCGAMMDPTLALGRGS